MSAQRHGKTGGPNPLTREAARQRIEREWLGKEIPPGTRLPSAREIGRCWSCDYSTVSRAMNDLVLMGLLEKSGYKYTVAGRSSTPRNRGTVYMPNTPEQALRAAKEAAADYGLNLQPIDVSDPSRAFGKMLEVIQAGAEGMILWTITGDETLLREANSRGVPVVLCGRSAPEMSWISGNNRASGRQAVAYLYEQGHREFAYVGLTPVNEARHERLSGYRAGCRDLRLHASIERCVELPDYDAVLNAEDAMRLSEATAIVCMTALHCQRVLALLKAQGRSVPDAVSVISCQENPSCFLNDPPLTSIAADDYEIGQVAVTLLVAQMKAKSDVRRTHHTTGIRVEPRLHRRGSCGPGPLAGESIHSDMVSGSTPADEAGSFRFAGMDAPERSTQVRRIWNNRYAPPVAARLMPVDLRNLMNRGRTRYGQWLGSHPLPYFPTGRIRIHGIAFDLLDETSDKPTSCLVLAASSRTSGLPEAVTIPVGGRAERIYFLHAAGNAGRHQHLATYRFHLADGTHVDQPIWSLGQANPEAPDALERRTQASHIQDWWPTYPQFQHTTARQVIVTRNYDPLLYERYLYTLEWSNPRPEILVERIQVQIQPSVRARLAILAITTVS